MVDPKDCLFCRIVQGTMPAKKVYEDASVIAFLDINPRNPGHTLVIPKGHYETIFDFPEGEGGHYFSSLKKVATLVKNATQAHGVSIAQNNGSAAGQVVAHLHFHVIPRFLNEGPAALEAMLPVKKMDDQSLDKIASAIQGASPVPQKTPAASPPRQAAPQTPAPRPPAQPSQPAQRPPLKLQSHEPPKKEPKPKKKAPPEEEDDIDEFEEFSLEI